MGEAAPATQERGPTVLSTAREQAEPCSMLDHLEWSLEADWSQCGDGPPLRAGWQDRATRWRAGRPGSAAWAAQMSNVPQPTWSALQAAQEAAGLDAGFRQGEAFCSRRRYGWHTGLEERFVHKLDTDAADGLSPVARAVRGFLDICHVHPFADGNSRAACLWLVWTLVNAGTDVADLTPLMRLPKPAGNPRVAEVMAQLLGAEPSV